MAFFIVSFLCSLVLTILVVLSSARHGLLSADHDLRGPQKFHTRPVPRIGGVGIFIALLAGCVLAQIRVPDVAPMLWMLIVTAMPAYLAGIVEDLTKTVPPRQRLAAAALSGGLGILLLDGMIQRTHIPGLDQLVVYLPVALALTLLVTAGVSNAVNLIDGFNGLASMCVLMMMLALAYVAFLVGDPLVAVASLIVAGAVFGFFVWNFPAGLIFLGDGGAYLLGFLLAELGILLVNRNAAVSPIFPLLLCAYPIFETLFTMYRRKFVRGVPTAAPDGIHLHTLIHRRLIRWTLPGNIERRRLRRRNSMTSPYLWLLCLTSVVPSVLWWDNTTVLSWFLLAFVIAYIWLYASIVRFRTPRWMVFRRNV